ncbi:MAG: phosphotransferase [Desulfobacter sp.]|nr:phosphotransferase [Desulfobacter sp.]WDP86180.1 MAG: phosphotransferase [Desulfobacter sp.]
MKALILAAGFGTRLLPHTRTLPKPLFTINNHPVLDRVIGQLKDVGCSQIFINTHHLSDKIRDFISAHPEQQAIELVHEPVILDTGGAIANLKDQLSDDDFILVNADIVWDLDLAAVIQAHKSSGALATLVVHDFYKFNKLLVNHENQILDFDQSPDKGLAFTGIQVLNPKIFDHMDQARIFSSVDLYKSLCPSGKVYACTVKDHYWTDIGTPKTYEETSRQCMAAKIFNLPYSVINKIKICPLAGDGSDRNWFRAVYRDQSLVLSDHGITENQPENLAQVVAFVAIGQHLNRLNLQVPKILGNDRISGQVALEDLGDTHLANMIKGKDEPTLLFWYQQVIDGLVRFSREGIREFNPEWTCQTPTYSKSLILDMECRYFLEAFIKGYLGKDVSWQDYEAAFIHIADNALIHGVSGLMHRDMQSKNIMVHKNRVWFIDFQSARQGPIQYDLASLLIDPYVTLAPKIQEKLMTYALSRLKINAKSQKAEFVHSFKYCCLTRNLQILGAFGFLTRNKNKPGFESHIPAALTGLKGRLEAMDSKALNPLTRLVNQIIRSEYENHPCND